MNKGIIVNIRVENLYPHPENPRKDIGDISELAESVKKSGIMQNLTVIPLDALDEEPDKQTDADKISPLSDFIVLIGHRRLAAAKKAGLKEVPCKIISHISKKEQVGIMLEENMQRSDLTIYEQAQGFQMMLDLGETEQSIAEKTGFSKTTIRRRLNIAKLDQTVLKDKQDDESFQLSLTDLYELDKVEDIETRNKILSEARDSREITSKVLRAVREAEKEKKKTQIVGTLEEMGVEKAPDNVNMYDGKWTCVKEVSFDKDVPERIPLKKSKDPYYWREIWSGIQIIQKVKKQKKELTPEEIRQNEIKKNKKNLEEKFDEMAAKRKEFVRDIIDGKIKPLKDTTKLQELLWEALMLNEVYISEHNLKSFFCDKGWYHSSEEEKKAAEEKAKATSKLHQALAIMTNKDYLNPVNYDGTLNEKDCRKVVAVCEVLKLYGFSLNAEEEQLLDGTHELYVKEEE